MSSGAGSCKFSALSGISSPIQFRSLFNCPLFILLRTSNGDGTEKVEIIGCKAIENGNEIEVDLVFPRVSEIEQASLISENGEIFTIYIPD